MTDPPGAKLKSAVDRAAACIVGIRASSLGLRSVLVTRVGGAGREPGGASPLARSPPVNVQCGPAGEDEWGRTRRQDPRAQMIEDEPK